jgi:hypothetical protein
MGVVDMAFLVVGVAIGGLCALFRYRVFLMLALSALLAVSTVLAGIIFHTYPWAIVAEAVGSIVAFQFTYVAVGITHGLIYSRTLIPRVQAAVGEQLGVELELPRDLPPGLSELVAQLRSREAALELSGDRDFVN